MENNDIKIVCALARWGGYGYAVDDQPEHHFVDRGLAADAAFSGLVEFIEIPEDPEIPFVRLTEEGWRLALKDSW